MIWESLLASLCAGLAVSCINRFVLSQVSVPCDRKTRGADVDDGGGGGVDDDVGGGGVEDDGCIHAATMSATYEACYTHGD